MKDNFARKIDYMRVSVTDRCNLRCAYCMPTPISHNPHTNILRYEEILRLCAIMAKLGVKTVRVTGGEPLVRKGCVDFIRRLKKIPGILFVALTTNGVLLEQYLEELKNIGLDSLNISLDSLCPDIYAKLTNQDAFEQVWTAINKALQIGLRVKLNFVPIKGINDSQILAMASLPENLPLDVRFIEFMPTKISANLTGIPEYEILARVKAKYPDLVPDTDAHGFGPATYFKTKAMRGSIGFISSISENFCADCNRVRLSSDGFLTLCLHHRQGLCLRQMLRSEASDGDIAAAIRHIIAQKPEKHLQHDAVKLKHMSKIGG